LRRESGLARTSGERQPHSQCCQAGSQSLLI
jgi:hypothetical protein